MAVARSFSLLQQVYTISGGGHVASVSEYQEMFFPGALWVGHKAEIENKWWKSTNFLPYVCMAYIRESTVLLLHKFGKFFSFCK